LAQAKQSAAAAENTMGPSYSIGSTSQKIKLAQANLPDLELRGSATPRIGLTPASGIPARSHIPSTEFSPLLVYHYFSLISRPFPFMHSSLFSDSSFVSYTPFSFPFE
jgi:hypothetical protein